MYKVSQGSGEGVSGRRTSKWLVFAGALIGMFLVAGVVTLLLPDELSSFTPRSDISFPAKTEADIARAKAKVNPALTYDIVRANANLYKNEVIRWPAQVYVNYERTKDGALQLRVRASEKNKSYLVIYNDPKTDIVNGDTYMVTGVVGGVVAGDKLYGEPERKIVVYASHMEKVAKQEAFHPAIESRKLTQSNAQNGFIVSLERIERARDETRLFVTINNTSSHAVSMYEESTLLLTGSERYERMLKYSIGNDRALRGLYPPDTKSSGMITYPAITSLDGVSFYSIPPYTNTSNLDWYEVELEVR